MITCFSRRPSRSPSTRIRISRGSAKNGPGRILAAIRIRQIIIISIVIHSIPLPQLAGPISTSTQDSELLLSVRHERGRGLRGEIGLIGEEDAGGVVLVGRVDPGVADEVDGGVFVAGDGLEG